MNRPRDHRFAPGASVLGGAAGGLSYEGLMRDAMATEERLRRQQQPGRIRIVPRSQMQSRRPEAGRQEQARIAGQ
ncbi:hypothetical protein [Roseicella frigidaeris]|uniref:Uncharacterized protein n=1 Tax=Roseicella frigidaeris TaxID=2230885 RepID=A0A327LX88_9PROT|nr:hypothetical protein [Roseicella frigidaeris]RAI55279.1 hypothetical protein DOO78_24470 [Roseicella frigidaeris]